MNQSNKATNFITIFNRYIRRIAQTVFPLWSIDLPMIMGMSTFQLYNDKLIQPIMHDETVNKSRKQGLRQR